MSATHFHKFGNNFDLFVMRAEGRDTLSLSPRLWGLHGIGLPSWLHYIVNVSSRVRQAKVVT